MKRYLKEPITPRTYKKQSKLQFPALQTSLRYPEYKSYIEMLPDELIFHVIKYIENSNDMNKFIYAIKYLRYKFLDDVLWQRMLYQNLSECIINTECLWKDNYYSNMDLASKYSLQVIPLDNYCDVTSYYILTVDTDILVQILNSMDRFLSGLNYMQTAKLNMLDNHEIRTIGNPFTQIVFIDEHLPHRDTYKRTNMSNDIDDAEFIKVFVQMEPIIQKADCLNKIVENRICFKSNIINVEDVVTIIRLMYGFTFKNDFSPLYSFLYKNSRVLGCQLEIGLF